MTHGDADQVILLERAQSSVAGLAKPGFEFKVYPGLGELASLQWREQDSVLRCCMPCVEACTAPPMQLQPACPAFLGEFSSTDWTGSSPLACLLQPMLCGMTSLTTSVHSSRPA